MFVFERLYGSGNEASQETVCDLQKRAITLVPPLLNFAITFKNAKNAYVDVLHIAAGLGGNQAEGRGWGLGWSNRVG